MKKNSLVNSIKILGLCFVLLAGVFFADAQTIYGPLNTGPSDQTKVGGLHITNGGFRAKGNSLGAGIFDDKVVVGYTSGINTGVTVNTPGLTNNTQVPNTPAKLVVYGNSYLSKNLNVAENAIINGNTEIDGIARTKSLNGGSGYAEVCVNSLGQLMFCSTLPGGKGELEIYKFASIPKNN